MRFKAELKVWTRRPDDEDSWVLRLTTDDAQKAATTFQRLDKPDVCVAIYEKGRYEHDGKRVTGQVGFLWNDAFNDYMQGEPEGRGYGWSEDYDTYVEYDYPGRDEAETAETEIQAVAVAASAAPEERYAEGCCDGCYKLLPMNYLKRLEHEVEVGRTSGSSRFSHSSSHTTGSRSFSSTSRNGSSYSSGRKHYKRQVLWLCDECYARQVRSDRAGTALKILGSLGLTALSIFGGQ